MARKMDGWMDGWMERERVCVCVCVCESESESESERVRDAENPYLLVVGERGGRLVEVGERV